MGCKPLDDIVHSGHRNIKIPVNGLVALSLSVFFHNFFPQSHRPLHFFLFCMLNVTQHKRWVNFSPFELWLQVWLLYCPHLLLATGVSNYKLQEHHLLEKQLFLTILTIIVSSPFLSSVWNSIKFDFSSVFFVLFQCNKQTREYQNICNCSNFSNNFRDNGCIFWQNCKGANIFGYFCNFDVCTMCVFDAIDSYENVLFCSVVRLV